MTPLAHWIVFFVSSVLFLGYEINALWVGHRHPERLARSAHARMRADWVAAMSRQAGFEIVAVQTLRNSLMSATIAASTAALALMGSLTLAGPTVNAGISRLADLSTIPLRTVLEALLILTLFSSYVSSAMAMRYFNHASFVMSMPVASPERDSFNLMATTYVERAGLLYSWGLRFFLMVAPLVAGVVNPAAILPATIGLIFVMRYFDRPAAIKLRRVDEPGPVIATPDRF